MFSNQQINPNTLNPQFEGFFLEMVVPNLEKRCQEVVSKILGEQWDIKPIGDNLTEFEITLKDDTLSVKQAWDKTYELRSQPGVIDVEPLFAVPVRESRSNLEMSQAQSPTTRSDITNLVDILISFFSGLFNLFSSNDVGSFNQSELDSDDVNWVLRQMKVFQAWEKYFPDPNKLPGHGIIIAHPDTGYTQHPEIMDNLLLSEGYDFVSADEDETDPLERSNTEIINNPGHGTSTASVIISPQRSQGDYSNEKHVTGVVPGAKLVPLRVSYSVVLLSNRNLANSIEYAADKGFHVISISLGTAFQNKRLRIILELPHCNGERPFLMEMMLRNSG